MKMKDKVKPLTDKEIGLLNEIKGNCLNGSKYKDEKAKDEFYMLCHLEDFVIKHDDLLQENKKYKEVIFKIKMIISARIKEYQKKIDNEIDMGSQGDHFKICRYEENIKFLKDILKEVK